MHEEFEPNVVPKETVSSEPTFESAKSREGGMQAVLAKLQERGEALLKTMGLGGNTHLERLNLVDNPEAKKAAEKYDVRRQERVNRVREKLAIAATIAVLGMGAGKAAGAEVENLEEDLQSVHAEQSIMLKDEAPDIPTLQSQVPESTGSITYTNETGPEKWQSNTSVFGKEGKTEQEIKAPQNEKPLSADEKEYRELSKIANEIASACLGLEKDNCLVTVAKAAVTHVALDYLIPFKRGFSQLKEAVSEEKMEAGERFGKALSGIFNLLTDVATLQIGGKGVIQAAQLYRAYQGVSGAQEAYAFYVENKKAVHTVLQKVFGGASSERTAVENTLSTFEKIGQTSVNKNMSVQTN